MDTALSIAGVIFGVIGFLAGGLALRTLGRLRHSVALLSRGASGRETILEVTENHVAASLAVRRDITELRAELTQAQQAAEDRTRRERAELAEASDAMARTVRTVLRRVGLVRYDAFEDLGGRLSFSVALMDDNGDGITLTSIASQHETRLYAKSVSNGAGEHALSPEEEQAVQAAMTR